MKKIVKDNLSGQTFLTPNLPPEACIQLQARWIAAGELAGRKNTMGSCTGD